jgi:endonuclease YncB( thermonuclease family)
MRYILLAPILAGALLHSSNSFAGPACAGPIEIIHASVPRLDKNDSLILSDGRALHLEGIRLPAGKLDRAPQSFADEARAVIAAMAKTAPLALSSLPPKIDRHNRLRVQAFVGESWIQKVLLDRGLARVSIAPDRTDCAAELFAAEAQARGARRGLWADPAYAVRTASNVERDVGTFQIVEGTVLNASVRNGRAYLNFGGDWRTDLTATVDPEDMPNFRALGVDPRSYVGQTIRVRGWLQWHNGPEIEAANPQGIEVVP